MLIAITISSDQTKWRAIKAVKFNVDFDRSPQLKRFQPLFNRGWFQPLQPHFNCVLDDLCFRERIKTEHKHYRYGSGKDVVLWSAPPNECRDTQHPTWRTKEVSRLGGAICLVVWLIQLLVMTEEMLFSGIRWEAWACTPPGVLLRYYWGLRSLSRLICMIHAADLVACRLVFS